MVDDFYSAGASSQTSFDNLYIKNDLSVGRVEVCLGGIYNPICDYHQLWNNPSVSVVCSQLGFSPYGEL